eukprot:scaffold48095_cov23-Phaeocystis_antarctica.AAC.2
MDAMRVRALATWRAPARSPALRTHSTPPLHFLTLTLPNTHPLLPRFLADLKVSFPTRCGRSCDT